MYSWETLQYYLCFIILLALRSYHKLVTADDYIVSMTTADHVNASTTTGLKFWIEPNPGASSYHISRSKLKRNEEITFMKSYSSFPGDRIRLYKSSSDLDDWIFSKGWILNMATNQRSFFFCSASDMAEYCVVNATRALNLRLVRVQPTPSGPVNIAKNKTATSSSIEGPQSAPEMCTRGDSLTARSCCFTQSGLEHWLMVDLGRRYQVGFVRLDNEEGTNNRVRNLTIAVGDKFVPQGGAVDLSQQKICERQIDYPYYFRRSCIPFVCDVPQTGRYVTVHMTSHDANDYLNICEVEVYIHVPLNPATSNHAVGRLPWQLTVDSSMNTCTQVPRASPYEYNHFTYWMKYAIPFPVQTTEKIRISVHVLNPSHDSLRQVKIGIKSISPQEFCDFQGLYQSCALSRSETDSIVCTFECKPEIDCKNFFFRADSGVQICEIQTDLL